MGRWWSEHWSAEKSKLSPREQQAYQDIGDHIKDAELESPLFQAFADAVDLWDALKDYDKNDFEKVTRKGLIENDIRKNTNSVTGYLKKSEEADQLLFALSSATMENTQAADTGKAYVAMVNKLTKMKREAIRTKSKSPPPPQA
jgi:hypothetical protein